MSESKNVMYLLIIFFFVIFSIGFIVKIELQKNEIEELNNLIENTPKPLYLFENSSDYEHNFFKYDFIEFSSYTDKKNFYGLHITEIQNSFIELIIYCEINESKCNIEFQDLECLNNYVSEKNILNLTFEEFDKTNCSKNYIIKGNVS